MKRRFLWLWILLAAASLALAGKPGGGGGSSLTGRFYVFTGKPVYSALGVYGARDITGNKALKPDGSADRLLFDADGNGTLAGDELWPPLGEPTHGLHNGGRVFVEVRFSGTNPDGGSSSHLIARREDGTTQALTTVGEDLAVLGPVWLYSLRWGKDDSFVSYTAIVWDSGGSPSAHIFRAGIIWGSGGFPSLAGAPQAVVNGNVTPGGESNLRFFDWSPDGSAIVFEDGADLKVSAWNGSDAVDATDVAVLVTGRDPAWSPAAGSVRIAFTSGDTIRLIDGDGTDAAQFSSGGSATESDGTPQWSAAGTHLAFLRFKPVKVQGQSNYRLDIYAGPTTGGSQTKIAVSDSVDRFTGWRDS